VGGVLLALPLQLFAQALPPATPPAALRDPSERLLREQQERERTPTLRPHAVPEAAPKDDRFAPFPDHLQAEGPAFQVDRIEGIGNMLLDANEFRRIVEVFEGRQLAAVHVQALLDRLTRGLVAAGYISSRAHVDAQNIAQGQLSVSVQAGRIEQIRYNNLDIDSHAPTLFSLSRLGIRMALPMQRGDVLRLADIEQAVDQINRLRRNKVEVQILPGEQPGGSIIALTNMPGDARSYPVSVDNQGAVNTGRMRIQAGMEQGNALGLMESLSLGLVTSTETNAVFGSFSIPLGYYTLSAMRSWSEYQNLIGDTALVYGTSHSTSIALNRLLSRSQTAKLAADLSVTKRRSLREINNLSLTPQQQTVLRAGLNRLSRFDTASGMGQWTFDMGVVRGLTAWSADRDAPDLPAGAAHAQFTKLEGNASLGLPLSRSWIYRTRVAAQFARTPLYSSEQLFAGGVGTVRGFAESAAGGDRGVSWRNEWAAQVPAPFGGNLWGQKFGIEPYLFADGARLRTNADGRHASLSSVGAGVRFALGSGSGEFIFGKPLHAPVGVEKAIRSHVQFGWQF
jgi:hemolysin activation/secretion protein